jgi:hypothetical protein
LRYAPRVAIEHQRQRARIVIAQGVQQQRVHQAEHRAVRPDAEGQRQNHGQRDSGGSQQNSEAKSQILQQRFHEFREKAVSL